jgi:hypothetical protein
MKFIVIKNFVDKRIQRQINENKNFSQIIDDLHCVIDKSDGSNFKTQIADFSKKRIDDINYFKGKEEFKNMSERKIFNLIQFKDMVIGKELEYE